MSIHKTCLKAGHRWGRPIPVPYQGVTSDFGNDGWMEVSQCQRVGCARYRVDYTDMGTVTYDASSWLGDQPIVGLVVVRRSN